MPPPKRLYAEGTTVSAQRSQQEIIAILKRYGAEAFSFGEDREIGMVAFRAHGRLVRFLLPLNVSPDDFKRTRGNQFRDLSGRQKAMEAEVRRRWRALAMAIKAKLEVVESGIATFEQEFLSHFMLPSGDTVGDFLEPQLEKVYADNTMPELLPGVRKAIES